MANASRKGLWVKLAVVLTVLAVGAVLVARGVDVRGLIDRGLAAVRGAGPVAFFTAMAVLPALGAPLMAFTIPAGEVFRDQLGLGGVIACALAVIAINLAFAYWLSRYALRPLLTGWLKRYGYSVPRITPENALNVLLVVRLTPGPPYALQCALLGVAEAPFRLYMIVSWLAVLPWAVGAIVLGQGLLNGNFRVVMIGAGVLVAAVVGVQWARKKYFRRGD
jgi:uncharacterized membrane protein YdjX (TVP38/TMEM64 family)